MGDSSSLSSPSSPASYIHLVHRLIEECILFNMNKEECMDALSKHARIQPIVTSTVWKGLEKENPGFFDAYAKQRRETTVTTTSREANIRRLQELISDDPAKLKL
ncbi:hypothetical protein MLD38_033119 [Melastoma candidum]|uniref:Uncharacterized protein n=1 Tax=Melastoma candidum TaxID=119954 RepID=A0ACB9M7T5_9MYRT|nr:hypothetical protein MLD38_033119 [Melastoma candidum]